MNPLNVRITRKQAESLRALLSSRPPQALLTIGNEHSRVACIACGMTGAQPLTMAHRKVCEYKAHYRAIQVLARMILEASHG